jgi:hypothetical protein
MRTYALLSRVSVYRCTGSRLGSDVHASLQFVLKLRGLDIPLSLEETSLGSVDIIPVAY